MKKVIIILSVIALAGCHLSKKQTTEDYLVSYAEYNDSLGYELFGYKNTQGEIAIKAKYHITETDTFYNIAFVISDSGWVAIDRNETILLYPFIFDNGPDYVREGSFRFVENNKMGFADTDCKKIIPAIFDFVTPFEDGIAIYTLGGYKNYMGEHWFWTGGYEKGYLNHSVQLFTKVAELQNGTREAWTKDNEHVLLNEKGEFVKRIE
ncbi:hypothetical protein FACS1894160_0920 [Bacteroidia bacterium]|nr:hypothetical protein FACS1894123_08940 [Bacteroidia bacterium]GHV07767.1 hypothetical protein FACS1894160_0920 [Bacteroidia bacterium]